MKPQSQVGRNLWRRFADRILKLNCDLALWLHAIWVLLSTVTFITQAVRQPSSPTILGEDDLVHVPTKPGDMWFGSHHIIVSRPPPNVEFSVNVSGVKLRKAAFIERSKAYCRDCSGSE